MKITTEKLDGKKGLWVSSSATEAGGRYIAVLFVY